MQPTIIVQYICAIIGIPINFLVLVVRLMKLIEQGRMSSYHIIITNLAFADFISSTVLTFEIKNATNGFVWPFSLTACYLVKGILVTTTSIGGLFILLLSFERYYGTINMTVRKWQRKTTVVMTIFVWIAAILIQLPEIMNIHMFQFNNIELCQNMTSTNNTNNAVYSTLCKPDTCVSGNKDLLPSQKKIHLNVKFILTIVIPVLTTIYLHYKLYAFIKSHARHMMLMTCDSNSQMFINQSYNNNNNNNNNNQKRKLSPDTIPPLGKETQRKSLVVISEEKMLLSSTLSNGSTIQNNMARTDTQKPSFLCLQAEKIKKIFQRSPSQRNTPKIQVNKKGKRAVNKNIRLKCHVLYAISIALLAFSIPIYTFEYLFLYKHSLLVTLKWKILVAFTYVRYLHCFVNALIYSIIDKRFRNDVYVLAKTIMTCKKPNLNNMDGLLIPSGVRTRTTSFDSNP